MMTKYSAEFTDINHTSDGQSRPAAMTVVDEPDGLSGGCHVSKKKGILLVLTILAVIVIVGVVTHYVTKNSMESIIRSDSEKNSHNGQDSPYGEVTTMKTPTRPTDVRLPKNIVPIHYNVELRPEFYGGNPKSFYFTGLSETYIKCKVSTDVIVIHIKNLNLDKRNIRIEPDTTETVTRGPHEPDEYEVVRTEEDEAREWIKIYLVKPLDKGAIYKMRMAFNASITNSLSGLYWSSYKVNNETRWLVVSDLEPTDARRILPCFDEPAFKATFNITLLRREGFKALSNMPKLETIHLGGEWFADRFQQSPKMSTYLLAFIICDFQSTTGYTQTAKLFSVYARPEAIPQAGYAQLKGMYMHNYFENFFNISYPLPKQDLIAIPDFASGAMENWGLITFRETALLVDEAASSIVNKQRVATVVSHELAHQWFGNLVSPAWWDDLWLNEGFASYVEYLGVNSAEPTWDMMDLFVTDDLQKALALDSLASSHPIYQPVHNPEEIREIFDTITYSKGSSVIRMMHSFLGDNTFRRGLTRYLNSHQYCNANHNDLWTSLTEQSHIDGSNIDVGDIMNTWVKQMGHPVVTVIRDFNQSRDSIQLTQSHFLLNTISDCPHHKATYTVEESPYNYRWKIPFTYSFGPRPDWNNPNMYWMMDPTGKERVTLNTTVRAEDWIIGNAKQEGYYRVNYDNDNWMKLSRQLRRNHSIIHVRNRAQILDDSIFLGRAGIINQTIGLGLAQYLTNEKDYLPWKSVSGHLYFFDTMLERTDFYEIFQNFVRRLVEPLYRYYNSTRETATDRHTKKLLRNLIQELACNFGIQDCLQQMRSQFNNWMNNARRNPIVSDMRSKVYCHAVREGGLAEWEFAYRQYTLSNVAVEKDRLLSALSCTRHSWLLSRLINLAWKELPRQDTIYTLARISNEPNGRPLVWNYFRTNWPAIKERYGENSFMLGRLFGSMTSAFNSKLEIKEMEQFKAEYLDLGNMSRAYKQAIEKARVQMLWLKKNEEKLRDWFTNIMQ